VQEFWLALVSALILLAVALSALSYTLESVCR
jgi:hypothetical protein